MHACVLVSRVAHQLASSSLVSALALVHYHTRSPTQLARASMRKWRAWGYSLSAPVIEKMTPPFPGMHYRAHVLRMLRGEAIDVPTTFNAALDTISLAPLTEHLHATHTRATATANVAAVARTGR